MVKFLKISWKFLKITKLLSIKCFKMGVAVLVSCCLKDNTHFEYDFILSKNFILFVCKTKRLTSTFSSTVCIWNFYEIFLKSKSWLDRHEKNRLGKCSKVSKSKTVSKISISAKCQSLRVLGTLASCLSITSNLRQDTIVHLSI